MFTAYERTGKLSFRLADWRALQAAAKALSKWGLRVDNEGVYRDATGITYQKKILQTKVKHVRIADAESAALNKVARICHKYDYHYWYVPGEVFPIWVASIPLEGDSYDKGVNVWFRV